MSTAKGKKAEDRACRYLEKHGYAILDRNRRLGRGELDIVASKVDILAFVEVKGHQNRESSIQAMHHDKQQRLISAAQTWLGMHAQWSTYQCRFDLMIVTPASSKFMPAKVEHVEDIIRL